MASADSFYAAEASDPVTDWQDYSNYYDEYDDDEEVIRLSSFCVCKAWTLLCSYSKPVKAVVWIMSVLQLA